MSVIRQAATFFGLIIQLGLTMVVSIFIGYYAGAYLDRLLGLSTILSIVGAIVGIAAGFWGSYRLILHIMSDADKQNR